MLSRFFIDRPIFATVLSVVIVLMGGIALNGLPIAQYPEVAPPTISITAVYPGANAKVVAESVATPIEAEVNGVERMLYMTSRSSNDGRMTLDVTFEVGTDLNMAQVLVQNRVSIAESKLPDEVKRQGVTTKKKSPSILLCVNLISPSGLYDALYLSNYATIQVKDALARVPGVGDVALFGAGDYSMRIWLDPEKLASRGMTATDVVKAMKEQNVQVSAGRLGQPPVPPGQETQLVITTLGKLLEPEEFADIIVKVGSDGQVVRVRDVGRAELGAKSYEMGSSLDGRPCTTLAVFQLPGSNAIATADAVKAKMAELKTRFPPGDLDYKVVYDTTVFVKESVHEVVATLFEAFLLVFVVVLVFLQDWRATILPVIDVIVSLVGTFAVMSLLGFSLNNLSMFGLILAIGIVVDDAIVVVENVERWMAQGLPAREATLKAMAEITGPVIAITLVLSSVFIPTAFIPGLSGEFYRQFALTIATSMLFSAVNSLTMAPARAVVLIKPHGEGHRKEALPRWGVVLIGAWLAYEHVPALLGVGAGTGAEGHGGTASPPWLVAAILAGGAAAGWFLSRPANWLLLRFFDGFNWIFDRVTAGYGKVVSGAIRIAVVMLVLYAGLIGLTGKVFVTVPVGFIPEQDKGYLVMNIQLPDGASLERTADVARRVETVLGETEGISHVLSFVGYSLVTSANVSNVAGMFVILDPFEERKGERMLHARALVRVLAAKLAPIQEAQVMAFGAPPVDGLGSTGGLKFQIQDRGDLGFVELQEAAEGTVARVGAEPRFLGGFASFRANQPQLFVDLNRTQAKARGVAVDDIFNALQVNLGSAYVNDFTRFNRNWQVNVQADSMYRLEPADIGRLRVRSATGKMIPLSGLLTVRDSTGPGIVTHFNMYPAADVTVAPSPGISSGQAMEGIGEICDADLPAAMGFEWTEIARLQQLAGDTAIYVFLLGAVLVFLVLSALYESWTLPLAILLIVPMCLLSAMGGVWLVGSDNNIFTQIGLVVLIGLAAKNAILVVEFAKQLEDSGKSRKEAVVQAAKVRLRPILMTSFAFILGVLPLVTRRGAGFEMRFALGIAVFCGMIGVTAFGVIFTPVFYSVVRWLTGKKKAGGPAAAQDHPAAKPIEAA
jgi:multidrug efflux pump